MTVIKNDSPAHLLARATLLFGVKATALMASSTVKNVKLGEVSVKGLKRIKKALAHYVRAVQVLPAKDVQVLFSTPQHSLNGLTVYEALRDSKDADVRALIETFEGGGYL